MKEPGQHGKQRLGGVEIEEGEDAAEVDCGHGAQGTQAHVALGMRLDDCDGRIGGGEFRRREG